MTALLELLKDADPEMKAKLRLALELIRDMDDNSC